jgi:hypothetical protein
LERGAAFAASRSCLEVVVRHAQDTDRDLSTLGPSDAVPPFEVLVRCWLNTEPSSDTYIEATLDVPSGRVVVGDAERWDTIQLVPGMWTLRVATTPADHPREVDIWLNQAAD